MSKEHGLSRWIRKGFPQYGTQEHWHRTDLEDGRVQARRYRTVPCELTVREFCLACNNGWMAHLETGVRPILGPMMTSSINLSAPGGGREAASEAPAGASAGA